MSSVRELYRKFKSSEGRVKLATMLGASGVATLALLVGILPAFAGEGDPSDLLGVQPDEVKYGGGSGACAAVLDGSPETGEGLPSAAQWELHINNPGPGFYEGPDGTEVELYDFVGDTEFSFKFVGETNMAAFDVVVNGGAKNTHFDYDEDGAPGPATMDTGLHAPTKGNALYSLSHINICYDINPTADLAVTKVVQGDATPNEGGSVTFLITATNLDNAYTTTTATGVQVTDNLPSAMTVTSWSASEGTFDPNTNKWTGLELAPGESQTLTLVVQIAADAGGASLNNTATISGDQPDPASGNDNANSQPPVVVNANLSGTVFVDDNASSSYDSGESGEAALTVTVYGTGGPYTTLSAADGTYSFDLAPGTYTVCLDQRTTHEQTVPDLPQEGTGVDCSSLGTHELVGWSVDLSTSVSGVDFGNLPIATCGTQYSDSGVVFTDANVVIFGNGVLGCGDKGLSFYVDETADPERVVLLLDGNGTAAGRLNLTKSFDDPASFVGIRYAPDLDDVNLEDLPWCKTRAFDTDDSDGKIDGNEFADIDALFTAGVQVLYPSLVGVTGYGGADPIACKVVEDEDLTGGQYTVVYFETLDPQFR